MRIFDLSSLIIPALAATGAVAWHAPEARSQTPPEPRPAIGASILGAPLLGAPLPAPVASAPLPPLPVGRPGQDPVMAPSSTSSAVMGRAVIAAPAAPQSIIPGGGLDNGGIVAAPAYAPAMTPHVMEPFKSMRDAFSKGMRAYNAGDKTDAARAFAYADAQGHAMSSWKLARMYAEGDGVPHDDLKAFEYYSKIADEGDDDGPGSPNARFVANAYVALGTYFLDGIPNSYVKLDAVRARDLFEHAATLFGDPDAQYNLARMMADGVGGPKDIRQAVRWLNLAAEKNHRPSQALLGHILFAGNGVPRQAAQGLMWLSLAREGSDPSKDAWISKLRDEAFAAANENERQLATLYIDQHGKGR
ncbi:Sel1 repeat-containing protein [Rhizobiales bacterium GAS191]|nr:Sel1 repeat-containing protein [Rhizobiales bacterium GAS191]